MSTHQARVLIIAGSDSGGGAGIQADIKTVTMMGAYAATAVTAVTVQDTTGVHDVMNVPADMIRRQIRAVMDDIGADALKSGMLATADVIEAVAGEIQPLAGEIPYVLDPVMTAKGGARLLEEDAVDALRRRLMPLAAVITPNIPEAAALSRMDIRDDDGVDRAAAALIGMGARAVLIKGGHLTGPVIRDVLHDGGRSQEWTAPRLSTRHTHGTGCTLASAIAAGLADGRALAGAVADARAFVRRAIENAPGIGRGHGPLGHARAGKHAL